MRCKIQIFLIKMTCHMTSHKGSIRTSRIFVFAVLVLLQLTLSLVSGQTDEAMPWSFRSMERLGSGSVDAFIEAQLTKQNLKPNAKADRYTLIRRATFDLTGLPPLPNEILSFVNDPLPDAYDRLIDRLLASPRYGERWGRYWLDLARYADTNGADENMVYPNAWRYRDYVIRSFNQDKPYDQFILEQLAGDLLPEASDYQQDADHIIATGFLVMGPKMLAEQDKEKLLMDVVDEQIDVVSRTFMGMSVACARCHDHKFDPIEQADYYALAGVFRSTATMANTDHVSRWVERVLPHPDNSGRRARFDAKKEALESAILALKSAAVSEQAKKDLKQLQTELNALSETGAGLPQAMAGQDGEIQELPLHFRGNPLTPSKERVRRDTFGVLDPVVPMPQMEKHRSGRLVLAEWLCHPDHPLTARVMVNRIWKGHFGSGLVSTPSTFGRRGALPTHSQLLDWLARTFIDEGWSIKAMHRLIMKSTAYQRDSFAHSHQSDLDPENRYLWRQNRRRLEGEPMRDALLQAGRMLDLRNGDALTEAIKGNKSYYSGKDEIFNSPVRSVYLPVLRSRVFDMFAIFDFPDASAHLEKRSETVMPQQALFYMNNELIDQVARSMVQATEGESSASLNEKLKHWYLTLFARYPSVEERALALDYVQKDGHSMRNGLEQDRLRRWIRILLASNEFTYLD